MAYASLGVRFGSLEINDPRGPYFDQFAGPTLWVTDGSRSQLQQIGFHIYAEFDTPVTSISFDAFGGAGFSIEAHARDELGNEIGVVASPASQRMIKGRFTLHGVGPISSIFWLADSPFISGVSIDNLDIQFVPEPSTTTLLLLGFAGCSAYRRRAQRPGPPDDSLGR